MHVLLSADNNYAQHLGVTIYSLLEQNRKIGLITIWVVNNGISDDNIRNLERVVSYFDNASIEWIDFKVWKLKLSLNQAWPLSMSAYARLFIASMLPIEVDRVIYMDCDMIVCAPLEKLWETDLGNDIIGAVQDDVPDSVKESVGVTPESPYFNSGLLLIDLDKWRQTGVEQSCLNFINDRNGTVIHHDQGVLNGVLCGKWLRLPIEYNFMTIHFIFSRRKTLKYYGELAAFYSSSDIEQAKCNPVILHFTPSFTSRPWVKNCVHPLKSLYWETLKKTPWCDEKPCEDDSKWYIRLINWRYRNLPF